MSNEDTLDCRCGGLPLHYPSKNCFRRLQARVEEMEMEHAIWEKHGLCQLVKERDSLQRVVNLARKAMESGVIKQAPFTSYSEALSDLREALSELDKEKQ